MKEEPGQSRLRANVDGEEMGVRPGPRTTARGLARPRVSRSFSEIDARDRRATAAGEQGVDDCLGRTPTPTPSSAVISILSNLVPVIARSCLATPATVPRASPSS